MIRWVYFVLAWFVFACSGADLPKGSGGVRGLAGAGSGGDAAELGGAGGEAGEADAGGLPQWYCSEAEGSCECELLDHPGSLHPCTESYACCVESADGASCSCSSARVCDTSGGRVVARCPAFLGEL